ncbi:MAG: hypothetical protein MMC33_003843 [Icmadophila ericetorum]|nr:hypothetical protein [Icmadophila ericetorum]
MVLDEVLEEALSSSIIKLSVNDVSIEKVEWLFELKWGKALWRAADPSPLAVPDRLILNLSDLEYANYDGKSEARCRLSVGALLVQALVYLRKRHEQEQRGEEVRTMTHTIPGNQNTPATARLGSQHYTEKCLMYPEPAISIQLLDPNGQQV